MIASHGVFIHAVVPSWEEAFSGSWLSLTRGLCGDLMSHNVVLVLLLFPSQPPQDLVLSYGWWLTEWCPRRAHGAFFPKLALSGGCDGPRTLAGAGAAPCCPVGNLLLRLPLGSSSPHPGQGLWTWLGLPVPTLKQGCPALSEGRCLREQTL